MKQLQKEIIEHLAHFISRLWQIHIFEENVGVNEIYVGVKEKSVGVKLNKTEISGGIHTYGV